MKDTNTLISLIPSYLDNKLNPRQHEIFELELQQNKELQEHLLLAQKARAGITFFNDNKDLIDALKTMEATHKAPAPPKPKRGFNFNILFIAAAALFGLILFSYLNKSVSDLPENTRLVMAPYPIKSIFSIKSYTREYPAYSLYSSRLYQKSLTKIDSLKLKDSSWDFVKATCQYYIGNLDQARESFLALKAIDSIDTPLPNQAIDFYLALIQLETNSNATKSILTPYGKDSTFPGHKLANEAIRNWERRHTQQ